MIRDLEEQALRIDDPPARQYMHEALRCYHAGAYRAAIVLSFACAFDYLRRSFEELLASGGGSKALREAFNKVREKFEAQDAYERQLLDVAASAGSVTPEERKRINALFDFRNLAAHPSGYPGTAEDARAVITTLIDVLLAKPVLLGVSELEGLLGRLQTKGFFPETELQKVAEVVAHEMKRIHSTAHAALVAKLFARQEALVSTPSYGAGHVERTNVRRFISGLWRSASSLKPLLLTRLERLAEKPETSVDLREILLEAPELFSALTILTRRRVLDYARSVADTMDGWPLLFALVQADVLQQDERDFLINSSPSLASALPLGHALTLDWPELRQRAIAGTLHRVGSSNFYTGRAAINAIQELPPEQAQQFDDRAQAEYVLQIAKAARNTTEPARTMVLNDGLGSRASFLDGFTRVLDAHAKQVLEEGSCWKEVAQLLLASGRTDSIQALLSQTANHKAEEHVGAETFALLISECPEAATAAQARLKALEANPG
ncbi:hypothetical protein FGE12_12250 [Aggregicoccus sp. 17bor-14]|uniref:hypothetical protein n=1 Tax=Myxococcaceae TaxID=31 RepID=UPI00129CAD42|nr:MULTISPECIES: hypothetical protein [Myxococcaceae]MBF5043161.1 hypothetical protein [Simulacricoccus sp. 17bor-14]MRI88920.1 hypothetical protein [Aggregicoccus sp. 17bor-14]